MYSLVRRMLFALDPEIAHGMTLRLLSLLPPSTGFAPSPLLARSVAGVVWRSPVGLAAGLDKNGDAIPAWFALGFGSVEVGTVTPRPQPGNLRPRLFRLPEHKALVNRMGFNNAGVDALIPRLRAARERGLGPVGVNIGKGLGTPQSEAAQDYIFSARKVAGLADWITVNVSSPNTPGLRDLQGVGLPSLLSSTVDAAGGTPVLVKLSPDLSDEGIRQAVQSAMFAGCAGVVATNTTTDHRLERGGLSGAPLWALSRNKIEIAVRASRLPVIGVGGVSTVAQAQELLQLGCAGVQLYTALVYEGPGLPERLNRGLMVESH